ncbi:hypothetical protein ACLKA6_002596 [Drosophila palustris]
MKILILLVCGACENPVVVFPDGLVNFHSSLLANMRRYYAITLKHVAEIRSPCQIRGEKSERTKILSTNKVQGLPGLIPDEGSRMESGSEQNSTPKPPPGYQVRPTGSILRRPTRTR